MDQEAAQENTVFYSVRQPWAWCRGLGDMRLEMCGLVLPVPCGNLLSAG